MPTNVEDRISAVPKRRAVLFFSLGLATFPPSQAAAQEPPPGQWLRLDPFPAEIKLTARESLDGVPPRFVLLTDGSVFVGGRRDVLRGFLDKTEMQAMSRRLETAMKSFKKTGSPKTLIVGTASSQAETPALFRFSVLLGVPIQLVVMGKIPPLGGPPLSPLPDFIRGLAGFRHPSLKPYDPAQFTMIVRERTLPGGCRDAKGLPPLAQAASQETVVSESRTPEIGKAFVDDARP
jgi:hypothetical protein